MWIETLEQRGATAFSDLKSNTILALAQTRLPPAFWRPVVDFHRKFRPLKLKIGIFQKRTQFSAKRK
jgi:hypothetical protein